MWLRIVSCLLVSSLTSTLLMGLYIVAGYGMLSRAVFIGVGISLMWLVCAWGIFRIVQKNNEAKKGVPNG